MGYPNTAYRTAAARRELAERRLPGFQGANDNRPGTVQRLPSRQKAPRYNLLKLGQFQPPRQPFGLAGRVALRNKALAGIKGGLRLRSKLLRGVAVFVLQHLVEIGREWRRTPPAPKHPGWALSGPGRWGTYPMCSGKTAAHNTGSLVFHGSPPLVFGHPWAGVPFDWAEYDAVDQVAVASWRFLQVGRGDQGTGPNPTTYYNSLTQLNPERPPLSDPWGLPYNPSWNRVPGRWPNAMPKPLPISPMIDPFSWPIREFETEAPMPIPFGILPHRVPNPWRSPTEQSQWGPLLINPRIAERRRRVMEERWREAEEKRLRDQDARDNPFDRFEDWWRGHNNPPPPPEPPKPPEKPQIRWRGPLGMEAPTRKTFHKGPKTRRPGKKVKEQKGKAASELAKALLRLANAATELNDFIGALFKALPQWAQYERGHMGWYGPTRRKITSIEGQWKAVYQHFSDIDIDHAIRAVARDQLEDMLYGSLGARSGKAAHARGGLYDPVSRIGSKKRKTDYEIQQALRKAEKERKKYFVGGDTPTPRSKAELDYWLDAIFGEDT